MSNFFCYQGNDCDCGFASLKMLLANINKNKSFLYLDKPKDKQANFSYKDLIEIAKQNNLILKAYKYEVKDIRQVKTPCLALLDDNHLVLINKLTVAAVLVSDPNYGKIKIKIDEFNKRWSLTTLEIDSYSSKEYKKKIIHILSPKSLFNSFLSSTVGVTSLIIGLFFINDNSYIFIPLILLTIFAISELFEKRYLVKMCNEFDNNYLDSYFLESNADRQNEYKNYLSFKKLCISLSRKIVSSFFMTAIITITLIINDARNSIFILALFLILIISRIIFQKKDKDKFNRLSNIEGKIFSGNNASFCQDIKNLSIESNQFALRISFRKCIETFICIILCFLLMLLQQQISVNFLLFHFGLFYILLINFNRILNYDSSVSKYYKEKYRFIDKCKL